MGETWWAATTVVVPVVNAKGEIVGSGTISTVEERPDA